MCVNRTLGEDVGRQKGVWRYQSWNSSTSS